MCMDSAANGTEISPKSIQKFLKLLNFEMRTIQPQNLEIPGAKLNETHDHYSANLRESKQLE